jgi:ammonia channel protein AmtB
VGYTLCMAQNKVKTILKEIGVALSLFLVSYYTKGLATASRQANSSIGDLARRFKTTEGFRQAFKIFFARLPWYQKMWFFVARFVIANFKLVLFVISVGFVVSLFIIFGVLPALLIYLLINAEKLKF